MQGTWEQLILIQGEAVNKGGGGNSLASGSVKRSPRRFPACVSSALSLTAERQPEFSEGLAGGEAQEEGEML